VTCGYGTEGSKVHGRILMLAPDPDIAGPVPGPIGKLASRLADALRSVGYEVDTELWGRHTREEGPFQKVTGRASDLLRIRRCIARGSYELVLVNTTHDSRALLRDLLLVLPSSPRVRWVLLIHGSHFEPGRPWFDVAARRLVRRSAAVLLLSSDEVSEWRRLYPPGHYYLVANALAPARGATLEAPLLPPRVPGGAEILYAGRLIREKGLYELVDAFATVRERRACHLTMAGEGPELEQLRDHASQLGIADGITFTGHLVEDELAQLYRSSDVFVLPSYSEGLPTVLLEAMSYGLPIVTTRLRGAADHLAEGENALFVPVRSAEALTAALDRVLDDAALRAKLRQNNLLKARDFMPARVVQAYVAAFAEVLAGREGK
jgi:glycosyltransferase involved in cell wall biosynthesis